MNAIPLTKIFQDPGGQVISSSAENYNPKAKAWALISKPACNSSLAPAHLYELHTYYPYISW